jgi:hypothetical protein
MSSFSWSHIKSRSCECLTHAEFLVRDQTLSWLWFLSHCDHILLRVHKGHFFHALHIETLIELLSWILCCKLILIVNVNKPSKSLFWKAKFQIHNVLTQFSIPWKIQNVARQLVSPVYVSILVIQCPALISWSLHHFFDSLWELWKKTGPLEHLSTIRAVFISVARDEGGKL